MSKDKVCIITPVYITEENQREMYLNRAFHSIQKLRYKNYIWLIVDDGSPKKMADFLLEASDYITSKKIIIIRREKELGEHDSASKARNFGIDYIAEYENNEIFQGIEYVVFLDSDDEILELDKRVKLFMNNTNLVMVSTSLERVHCKDNITEKYIQKGIVNNISLRKTWRNIYLNGYPYVTTMWKWKFMKSLGNSLNYEDTEYGIYDPDIIYGEDRGAIWVGFKYLLKNNLDYRSEPKIISYRYHWNDGSESVVVDLDAQKKARLKKDHKRLAKKNLNVGERIDRFVYKKIYKKLIK